MDYYANVAINRDEVAEMLTDRMSQTPYVLACVAGDCAKGTIGFDDFCDSLENLDEDMKVDLKLFCEAVTHRLCDR